MATPTEAELAELAALLQADPGNVPLAAIRAAVKASKPPRPPKKPKAPAANPTVTRIKKLATQVATLAERIDDARRTIYDIRQRLGVAASLRNPELDSLYVNLPSWQNELSGLAGQLARACAAYFATPAAASDEAVSG